MWTNQRRCLVADMCALPTITIIIDTFWSQIVYSNCCVLSGEDCQRSVFCRECYYKVSPEFHVTFDDVDSLRSDVSGWMLFQCLVWCPSSSYALERFCRCLAWRSRTTCDGSLPQVIVSVLLTQSSCKTAIFASPCTSWWGNCPWLPVFVNDFCYFYDGTGKRSERSLWNF